MYNSCYPSIGLKFVLYYLILHHNLLYVFYDKNAVDFDCILA